MYLRRKTGVFFIELCQKKRRFAPQVIAALTRRSELPARCAIYRRDAIDNIKTFGESLHEDTLTGNCAARALLYSA